MTDSNYSNLHRVTRKAGNDDGILFCHHATFFTYSERSNTFLNNSLVERPHNDGLTECWWIPR